MAMIEIKIMRDSDILFAVGLTDSENWGYLADDFRRLMEFEPEGCFVANKDNNPVGMVTTTSYEKYGFIGSLIVLKEFRRAGIGEKLMRRAIEYLKGKAVTAIELDATFPAAPLYRRLGFADKYLSLRFFRPAQKRGEVSERPIVTDIEKIIRFDYEKTGINRRRMLERYIKQIPQNIFIEGQKGISGYAIARPRAGEEYAIGPMVCDNISVANNLLKTIINSYSHYPLSIGLPDINQEMRDILLDFGFQQRPPSLRMYMGERLDYKKFVYGIFSAEKG
jgi:ribosomal protein S18 acetylase RimI-like enzyme